ncbi:P-loop containing nucleoside triphosphate hydrolase protein [Cubamyces lactineus]|nr:P-loop containing nucleoside triphosphate hydrolase protein [Cubamyces lactineus]
MPPRHPSPTSQPRWATTIPRARKRHAQRETRLSDTEIAQLSTLMQERFKWKNEPRFFQLEGVRAQLEGVDMIIQAPTGAGKTAVAAGPHVWASSRGKTSIMVCPLLALEDEMVETFKTDFGLRAVAINSATSTCTDEVVKELIDGTYQIVLISPEMLQSPMFVNRVLRKPAFAKQVLSLIIDEAHCVSHWGAGFRKKYNSLGVIRAFLPRGMPVIAVTATLTARVRRDLHRVLHFPKHGSRFVNVGNDRPNVTIAVRAIQHPQNTYADLNFVIPPEVTRASDIPKTYLYVDNILTGNEIVDHLSALLAERCPSLASQELVRPYNATMCHDYRHRAMAAFRNNPGSIQTDPASTQTDEVIRVLVCTDAAGMGCNVSDVDLVVQWKLPKTLSNFVQRAGRAARSAGRQGLAVLLVERSAYSMDLRQMAQVPERHAREQGSKAKPRAGRGGVQAGRARKGVLPKDYAYHHGLNRGSSSKTEDTVPTEGTEPSLDVEVEDEGLLVFVQTRKCRRSIWAAAFESSVQLLSPGISCCDICDPSVFDRIRPTSLSSNSKPRMRARGKPDYNAQSSLYEWRKDVRLRDHQNTQLDTSAILDVATITTLTSHGPLTRAQVTTLLKDTWIWWERYGNELCDLVTSLQIVHRPIKKSAGSAQKSAGVQPRLETAGTEQGSSNSASINVSSGVPSRARPATSEGLVEPAAKRARLELGVAGNACDAEMRVSSISFLSTVVSS